MKRIATCFAILLLAGTASAQTAAPVSSSDSELLTGSAVVTAFNPATRVVTMKSEDGKKIDVTAGEKVRNFGQIKVGDVVTVAAERSLTYTVSPRGTKLPDAMMAQGAGRAKPGEKPMGVAARSESLSGTIVAVNTAANTIDVVDQHGGPIHTLHVRNPERQAYLPKVHPGDMLTITYTETVGISVDPATKP